MIRARTLSWLGAVAAVSLTVTAACTSHVAQPDAGLFGDAEVPTGQFRLVGFDSCQEAEHSLRAAVRAHVGPWGLGEARRLADGLQLPVEDLVAGPEAPVAATSAGELAAPTGPDFSGTNVHEVGVDEPDLVKTDGRRIITVHQGVLRVVDVAQRVQTGALDLSGDDGLVPADLLLYGDQALVLLADGFTARPLARPDSRLPGHHLTQPRLLLVDLAGAPTIRSEYTIDGQLVDARLIGPVVRVVVRSGPRLEFPELPARATESERLAANRRVVDQTAISAWLPRYRLTTDDRIQEGQVECGAVARPETYTGTSMLTVLTFDLTMPELDTGNPVSVVADGDTVYGTGSSLYITSDRRGWAAPTVAGSDEPPAIDDRTEIYKFDISQPGPPRFVASGAVAGWLLNQYAMSEWDGHLRVATTSGEISWADAASSESAVTVLAHRGDELVPVGSVGGLGKGERIYSVRFIGPIGYVVTFRKVDPLYTVDLADPTAPKVLGELKITGYSSHLQPVGDGRLVGVGQEADETGRPLGTQVSLFDVSDLTDPTRLAQHHVPDGFSEAEADPHAFLWWPAEQMLVVPLVDQRAVGDRSSAVGALVLRVGERALTELAVIAHLDSDPRGGSSQIRRSLVTGDLLWTLSGQGLQANALPTLEKVAWVPFY